MTTIKQVKPHYQHHCPNCIFLGTIAQEAGYMYREVDLYLDERRDTIVIRDSDEPEEFGGYSISIAKMYVAQEFDGGDVHLQRNLAAALGYIYARNLEVRE